MTNQNADTAKALEVAALLGLTWERTQNLEFIQMYTPGGESLGQRTAYCWMEYFRGAVGHIERERFATSRWA